MLETKVYTVARGEFHKTLNELIPTLEPGETIEMLIMPAENDPGVIVIMVNWNK